MNRLTSLFLAGTAVWAGSVASAYAADASANADASQSTQIGGSPDELDVSPEDRADIVVTGTLIRGVAPAGTETITVTAQDIKESGALTTNDVLAKLPQVSFFNRTIGSGNDGGVGQNQRVNQPTIHGLPSLIMLDGHRIAPAGAGLGSLATSIDPSIIPTGVLGGIEVVPDGGSATYGSDAVGGVINMTTIKRFDGLKVDGAVGFADDYRSYRANATAGKDWGTGSVFVSYSYLQTDGLLGSARRYIVRNPAQISCTPTGQVTNPAAAGGLAAVNYTFTGVDANGRAVGYAVGPQACNNYPNESVLPSNRMHSVFAGLSQDLSSSIHVDLRAYYSTRRTESFDDIGILTGLANVPKTNPFYAPTPTEIANPARTQQVAFSLAPALGRVNNPAVNQLDTWGVSSEFRADVGAGFQVRLLGNYSQSFFKSLSHDALDSTLLANYLGAAAIGRDRATALDPYNVAATPGSIAAANQIAGRQRTSSGRTQQTQVRLVTDGTLFQIGSGDVKIAAGGELLHDRFSMVDEIVNFAGVPIPPRQALTAPRTVLSAFGELQVPLISPEDDGPIYGLHLSAAARFDHYDDFGNTFNPRFGASVMPVEWLTFRGTYGRSFVAPALQQLYAARTGNISNNAIFFPVASPDVGRNVVLLGGGNVNLKPQKATTWSLGLDLKAPFAEGLRAGLTYYNVHFTNLLGNPPAVGQAATFYTPLYQNFWIHNPTYQQAADFIAGTAISGLGFTSLDQLYGPNKEITANSPAYVITNRASNLGVQNTEGLDFDVSFDHATSFGSVDFSAAGNYILKNEGSVAAGAPFTDNLEFGPDSTKFTGSASAGANIGNFRISATLYHTSGYDLRQPTCCNQLHVGSYNTVDGFMSYTFKDEGYLENTVVSLNVTNLFDVRPPVDRTTSTGYARGSIIGRLIQLGLSKKL